jgi:hypothetical protein
MAGCLPTDPAPSDATPPTTETPINTSPDRLSIAALCKTAEDGQVDRANRAAAVFGLFANHLRAPCGPADAGKVFGEAKWLKDSPLNYIIGVAGLIPVGFGEDTTVYDLYLFPDQEGRSDWVIYLRLSGSYRSADEARAFLRGEKNLKGDPKLVEFALCYPDPPGEMKYGRILHFDREGMRELNWNLSDEGEATP